MPSSDASFSRTKLFFAAVTFVLLVMPVASKAQSPRGPMEPTSAPQPDAQAEAPTPASAPEAQTTQPAASQTDEPAAPQKAPYDPSIFQPTMTADQLAFLKRIGHVSTGIVAQNNDFHKLLKSVVPDCEFHYGRDMSLMDALDMLLKTSTERAQIRDNRYLLLSADTGPYLNGKAFMWFDMQSGIALGGFFFHPTNGEPTPTLAVFSKQVKESYLEMSQLPSGFAEVVNEWSANEGVQPILTRYFLTGSKKRVLLAHDEDYCSAADAVTDDAGRDCEQMNADAADLDMNAAYYLEQTHNATNATEWMALGEDQIAWIQVRDNTCGGVIDPLGCRIRMAHERTRVIVTRPSQPHRAPSPQPRR
jgi:uncharacterized protein YecT (DUF1311 family)